MVVEPRGFIMSPEVLLLKKRIIFLLKWNNN